VEIYAMPNQEAATVAQVLTKEFFSRYGVPTFLHSDQGSNFESVLFAEVCKLLGIDKTRTTPFHPQSDGQSERNIKTLGRMIAMSADEQSMWDEYLPFLSMAYRATPHAGIGLTPNFMMFGREISMPVDIMMGACPGQEMSHVLYVQKLQSRLEYAYSMARKELKVCAERQSKLYNKKTHGDGFEKGQLVWFLNKQRRKGISPKLQPKWRGPCVLLKMHSSVVVEIQVSARKTTTVHTDLLKPCHSTRLTTWMKRLIKKLKSA
jgi:hypothetical protein